MASIKDRAHAAAQKRVAAEVGELVLARAVPDNMSFASIEAFEAYAQQVRDAELAHERDWTASYLGHYFRAFGYYCAFELSGADAEFAKECMADASICREIEHRTAMVTEDLNA
jgi:hypothetical protein